MQTPVARPDQAKVIIMARVCCSSQYINEEQSDTKHGRVTFHHSNVTLHKRQPLTATATATATAATATAIAAIQ